MIEYYSSDYVLPVSSAPLENGVVAINDEGRIINVFRGDDELLKDKSVKKFKGIITPGFINSHCHLELSHLQGKTPRNQGLIPFVRTVIAQREADQALHLDKMFEADKAMAANGIVAVGDISNRDTSLAVKEQSPLFYHTYIELLGFNPDRAKEVMTEGLKLREKFRSMAASVVPHAPYSVSKDLLKLIGSIAEDGKNILSIHNQESEEENKLYRYKKGEFIEFYNDLNLNIDFFKATGRNSMQSILPMLRGPQSLLLVHNTYTNIRDVSFVRRFNEDLKVTWCLCPNANLYIENRLPRIDLFLVDDFSITIGTDSLASNDKLCILSELKALHSHFPELQLSETIKWASLNGAKFLGIDDRFGSIERGKTPGLNLITNTDGLSLTENSEVTKLC